MLSSFAIYNEGKELVVFTNPVKKEDLADLSGLSLCPATFQELLPKSLEIRVTVVGERVMSASINSQVSERAVHDWRRDGARMLQEWQSYQLPREVEEKILRLMDYFSLNYGAIDIILTQRETRLSRTQSFRRILLARTVSRPSHLRRNRKPSPRPLPAPLIHFFNFSRNIFHTGVITYRGVDHHE